MHESPDGTTGSADHSSDASPGRMTRRRILAALAAAGVGTVAYRRALAAQSADGTVVTAAMIEQAEWIAGIELDDEQRATTAAAVQSALDRCRELREVELGYDVAPAVYFNAAPGDPRPAERPRRAARPTEWFAGQRPTAEDDLAFLPVTELAALIRSRQLSSVELTRIYLDRLHRFDPLLHCVVSFTDDLAMRQARRADRELAAGRYRGPLHGIPWGAKDLIAYPGYKTTWGATPFQDQTLDGKATVARRLDEAGAVLVAKLSLGALAWGDKWFGGTTRNPWNVEQGSSGSSAGSAAATAAGLVGFAIGSETLGSIISPCRRCGCSGLRPTFGRVSRQGCMTLAWSLDKLGPICRSIEDCALVFDAIHGSDGLDPTAVDRPFHWPPNRDIRTLKVGYFEAGGAKTGEAELEVFRDLDVQLVPIELPRDLPADALTIILDTEAAAVFDPLTRAGVTEGLNRWPPVFRKGEFIPAVEYLRANRIRALLMREMQQTFSKVDAYIGGNDLVITNFTGHPTAVLPDGFRVADGVRTPTAVTLTGCLFGETDLLALASAYQRATRAHLERPVLVMDDKPAADPKAAEPAR